MKKMKVFNDFLQLCHLYKGYSQRFTPTDLYKLNLLENQKIISIDETIELWEKYLNKKTKGKINLFITMPYCLKRCKYCQYFKYELKEKAELEDYKNRFVALVNYLSPLLKKINFANLRFGGSTPSLFTSAQLEEIFSSLKKFAKIDETGEQTFECNPYTVNFEKFKIAKKYGFNRISLGVQSFNTKILKTIGRDYQKEYMVKNAVEMAFKAGFKYINIDLIMGIYGETPEEFARTFKKAIDLSPTSVFVYEFTPDREYLENFYNGDAEKFFKDIKNFEKKLYPILCEIAERKKYFYPSRSIFMLENKINGAVQFTKQTGDIPNYYSIGDIKSKDAYLGLGYQSDSYIPDIVEYQSLPLTENPKNNTFKAVMLDGRSAYEYYILNRISTYHYLNFKDFKEGFKKDFRKIFRSELKEIIQNKFGEIKGEQLILAKNSNRMRFLVSLYFLEYQKILKLMNKWLSSERLFLNAFGQRFFIKLKYLPFGKLKISLENTEKDNKPYKKIFKIVKELEKLISKEKDIKEKIFLIRKFTLHFANKM